MAENWTTDVTVMILIMMSVIQFPAVWTSLMTLSHKAIQLALELNNLYLWWVQILAYIFFDAWGRSLYQ